MSAQRLTDRQRDALDELRRYIDEHAVPPTAAELADALGVGRSRAQQLLDALEVAGAIVRRTGKHRSIRVVA